MKLEICANSYQSALNAQIAGADRIELCIELHLGGITPSYGLLKQVIDTLSIPVFVLIRPRSGDFTYSDAEFDIMKHDIQLCKNLGCEGIVSGILYKDQTIDINRTQELIELSNPLDFTFHRAFDCVPNAFVALDQLKSLGVTRILTSGQETTAEKGLDRLIQIGEKAGNDMIIIPGGGIHSRNALRFKNSGFQELHASASEVIEAGPSSYFGDIRRTQTNVDEVKAILNAIQNEV